MKIALVGKAGSGKTITAKHLREKYGFIHLSFATKVKEVATDLFKMEGKDRKLLQDLGHGMRQVRSTVWIDYLMEQVYSHDAQGRDIVIDDVRYMNEFERLRTDRFHMVKIIGLVWDMSDLNNHVSETELDGVRADSTWVMPLIQEDIPRYNAMLRAEADKLVSRLREA